MHRRLICFELKRDVELTQNFSFQLHGHFRPTYFQDTALKTAQKANPGEGNRRWPRKPRQRALTLTSTSKGNIVARMLTQRARRYA